MIAIVDGATMTTPMHERPTAAQIAAQSNGAESWTCPVCGCKDWRVKGGKWLRKSDLARRRLIICRHCGYQRHSSEYIDD